MSIRGLWSGMERIFRHPGVSFYGRNLFWIFAERGVRLLLGFAVGVYVARRMRSSSANWSTARMNETDCSEPHSGLKRADFC